MRFPDDVPVHTDGVVTLRAPTLADTAGVIEQANDPESIAWTTVPTPYGEHEGREWLGESIPQGWRDDTDLCFTMEYDRRFAGTTSLRPDRDGNAELAWGLAAWARGRHVTSRSVRMLLDWGFRERGFGVVIWRANAGNWPSRRVAWATGFTFGPTIPRLLDHRRSRVDAWTAWTTADAPRRPITAWLETPILETPRLRLRPRATPRTRPSSASGHTQRPEAAG